MGLSQHWRTTAGQAGQAGRGLEVRPVRVGQDNVSALVIANFCAFVRQHRDQSGADDCARDDAMGRTHRLPKQGRPTGTGRK